MCKGLWTPARQKSPSKIMGINMELVPPFAAITASTLLGRLSTRCWNIAAGTCIHSATRVLLVRFGATDVWCLARRQCSNSSQRCSMGLRSGVCAGQSRSPTPILTNHFCMDNAWVHSQAETVKGLSEYKLQEYVIMLLLHQMGVLWNRIRGC